MKLILYAVILTMVSFYTFAQKPFKGNNGETFPIPKMSANGLFYMQRSNNSNTVIYDANILKNKKINAENPVHAYWIRYAEGSKIEELSTVQRTLAYGLHFNDKSKKENSFEGYFFGYRKRKFVVELNKNNKAVALFPINGKMQVIDRIFVKVEKAGMMPDVPYIELFGHDPVTGVTAYEKFKP